MSRQEKLFNPVMAGSTEEAALLRDILPSEVPIKVQIKPEKMDSLNTTREVPVRTADAMSFGLGSPEPGRLPIATEFVEVETDEGTVRIPIVPAAHEDVFILDPKKFDEHKLPEPMLNPVHEQNFPPPPILELNTLNPEPKYDLEAMARHMRDMGPIPDRLV